MRDNTRIQVSKDVRDRLVRLGSMKDTYTSVLEKLLESCSDLPETRLPPLVGEVYGSLTAVGARVPPNEIPLMALRVLIQILGSGGASIGGKGNVLYEVLAGGDPFASCSVLLVGALDWMVREQGLEEFRPLLGAAMKLIQESCAEVYG